jgi:nucleotide-binding universal stress UspA family protein
MAQTAGPSGLIVVGVDGSPASRRALRWALDIARLTGAAVRAVTVWRIPVSYAHVPDWSDMDLAGAASSTLVETVREVTREDDPSVETVVLEGAAAPALLEAAEAADLLVVGARGRGGFAGLLLGSVTTFCVHHATCPVVVVPATPETA